MISTMVMHGRRDMGVGLGLSREIRGGLASAATASPRLFSLLDGGRAVYA
jgi:hypothetical protein